MELFTETQGGLYIGEGLILSPISFEKFGRIYEPHEDVTRPKIINDGLILSHMICSRNSSVFKEIINRNFNGYNDWFVPTITELGYISNIKNNLPHQYRMRDGRYWSCSCADNYEESSVIFAAMNIWAMEVEPYGCYFEFFLRPIRKLS